MADDTAEPQSRTVGPFELHGPGDAMDSEIDSFSGQKVESSCTPWLITGAGGVNIALEVIAINEGDSPEVGQVMAASRLDSPENWDGVVQRLRIGMRDAGEGRWTMDLRTAVRSPGGRPTRNVKSLEDYAALTGLDLKAELMRHGAVDVGIRQQLLGDEGRCTRYPAVLFKAGDVVVPAVAWTLMTLVPLTVGHS